MKIMKSVIEQLADSETALICNAMDALRTRIHRHVLCWYSSEGEIHLLGAHRIGIDEVSKDQQP